jgi:hypothetical protein
MELLEGGEESLLKRATLHVSPNGARSQGADLREHVPSGALHLARADQQRAIPAFAKDP